MMEHYVAGEKQEEVQNAGADLHPMNLSGSLDSHAENDFKSADEIADQSKPDEVDRMIRIFS